MRRQLRHVAAGGRRRHAMRLVWWTLAMVPQLPLMLTPLPNLTVYYTGYRIYSHFRAMQVAARWGQGARGRLSERAVGTKCVSIQAQAPWASRLPRG